MDNPTDLELNLAGLKSANDAERLAAVDALRNTKDLRAVEPLIGVLKDANAVVRRLAAVGLGSIKDIRAVDPLVRGLKDLDDNARRLSAEALGLIGDTQAFEPLVGALKDNSANVRASVANALGAIKDQRASVHLQTTALHDEDWQVRESAVDALKQFPGISLDLFSGGLSDDNAKIRERAEKSLTALDWQPQNDGQRIRYLIEGKKYAEAAKEGSIAGAPLTAILLNGELKYEEWKTAVAALAGIRSSPAPADVLVAVLKDRTAPMPRREEAARVLAEFGESLAVEPLLSLLCDEGNNAFTISYSLQQLVAKAGIRDMSPFGTALKHLNQEFRRPVAEAIGKSKNPSGTPLLIEALGDRDNMVRSAAAEGLGMIKDARAITPLIEAFNDENNYVGSKAVESLVAIGNEAVESLRVAMVHGRSQVRALAAAALKGLHWNPADARQRAEYAIACRHFGDAAKEGAAAVEPLIAVLSATEMGIAKDAAEALQSLKWLPANGEQRARRSVALRDFAQAMKEGAAATEAFIDLLHTTDGNHIEMLQLRSMAAATLGDLKTPRAIEALIKALQDIFITEEAIAALGKCRDKRACDALHALLQESNDTIRDLAIEALASAGDPRATGVDYWLHRKLELEPTGSRKRWHAGPENRLRVIWELVPFMDDPRVFERVVHALGSPDRVVAAEAARMLASTQNTRCVEPLIRTLGAAVEEMRRPETRDDNELDESHNLFDAAAKALGCLMDERALEPLIGVMTVRVADFSATRRVHLYQSRHVLDALGELGDERAIQPLRDFLDAKPATNNAREHAEMALKRISSKRD